jgi:hypothetical protein
MALDRAIARLGSDRSAIVTAALSKYLGIPVHALFQASISSALVEGVYFGEVGVKSILKRGDFGPGTFANLDGEKVVLDGPVYQVRGTGIDSLHQQRSIHFMVVPGVRYPRSQLVSWLVRVAVWYTLVF